MCLGDGDMCTPLAYNALYSNEAATNKHRMLSPTLKNTQLYTSLLTAYLPAATGSHHGSLGQGISLQLEEPPHAPLIPAPA